ncbi:MAG: aldehyde dehydrogenase family protein, partial [Gammaproteobacteria bacterium]|nr:aldehyde dehydrogenase family protein [Gammaproteobacteria bacterium]
MNKPDAISWHERARSLSFRTQAFVNGRYVDAASGGTFDSLNPATGKLLARVASGDEEDINRAVAAARAVFRKGSWANLAPAKRKRALFRFADLILKHTEELALLETLDMGKPIGDSLKVDVPGAARCIQWYAEAIDKVYDEVAPTGAAALATITREPLGVVGAIVPWNYPLLMAAWKIAPVLAAGNSMVLKPSEKSPLTALKVAELAVEAGIPEGVLNVVPGFGQTAGKALALHMDVDCIAFTGSTATGRSIMQYAGQSNLKRVSLECGGKSPNIVLADYPDLDKAASAAAYAIFINQGEVCSAGSRLLLQEGIKDAMLEKVQTISKKLQPGDPLDPGTKLGAIVDEIQMKRVLGYIDSGRRDGANLRFGGRRVREDSGGFFIEPTVFEDVRPAMTIAREEIFGPVVGVFRWSDEAAMLAQVNAVSYGLTASIWTNDLAT